LFVFKVQHFPNSSLLQILQAKGDTQQSHVRKRDTVNGKSEKKEEKEKLKDHDINERKEKEIKKESEEKGSDTSKYYFCKYIYIAVIYKYITIIYTNIIITVIEDKYLFINL